MLKKVIMHIDNTMQKHSSEVALKIFFSPLDFEVYRLLEEINTIDENILNTSNFQIRPIYSFDVLDDERALIARGRCMCKGRYCEDSDVIEGRGNFILQEAIRQKCIYVISKNEGNITMYTQYMKMFHQECLNAKMIYFWEECSDNLMSSINKTLSEKVNECFAKSFINEKDSNEIIQSSCSSNIHLEESFYFLDRKMRKALPLLVINDQVFHGKWRAEEVLRLMCISLHEESRPSFCSLLSIKEDEVYSRQSSSHKHIWILVIVIVGIALLNIVIYFIVRRNIARKLSKSVNSGEATVKIELKANETLNESRPEDSAELKKIPINAQ